MLAWLLPHYRKLLPAKLREPVSRALNWPEGGVVSYSAHGEDLFVRGWLDEMGVQRTSIRYLDIGCNHPSVLSNTFLFYRMGATGVVVEPTPHEASLIAKERPRDVLVRGGIAFDKRRSATLIQFVPSVFNTFSAREADDIEAKMQEIGQPIQRIGQTEVPLIPIMDIVRDYFSGSECHFLSIDVEGVDSMILQSIDWTAFRPWFVCCERPDQDISRKLLEAGYSLRAQVPHNAIFALTDVVTRTI